MATESPHWLLMEESVSTLSRLLLIRSFLYLQITRTCINYRTSSNFGQIGSLTTELAALGCLKKSHKLMMGKWWIHATSFIFIKSSSKLLVTRTGIKARSSLILGRIRPLILEILALEWRKFHTLELESNFMCSISGVEERLHKVMHKPPLTFNRENGVSTFSRLFLIWSFLYLHVKRTCIKFRTNSNFGQIGPLTTELAAI